MKVQDPTQRMSKDETETNQQQTERPALGLCIFSVSGSEHVSGPEPVVSFYHARRERAESGVAMVNHWSEKMPRRACDEAVIWCRTQSSIKTAWDNCERGDWMLWLLAQGVKMGSEKHRKIVLAACACARLSLKYVAKGEKRPLKAIETAERWARREKGGTLQDVKAAAADAAYAAYAADAADAADAAAGAAAGAAYAAYAADAAGAAYAAARSKTYKKCADIARKYFTYRSVYRTLK